MKKPIVLGVLFSILYGASYASDDDHKVITMKTCFDQQITAVYYKDSYIPPSGSFESSSLTHDKNCIYYTAGGPNTESTVGWVKSGMAANGVNWNSYNMIHNLRMGDQTPDELKVGIKLSFKFKEDKGGQYEYLCKDVFMGLGYNSFDGWRNWTFSNINNPKNGFGYMNISCSLTDSYQTVPVELMIGSFGTISLTPLQ